MSKVEKEFMEEIERCLSMVTKDSCPNIYERIQTKNGYSQVVDMIISMVINDNITPSACIPQIESEL